MILGLIALCNYILTNLLVLGELSVWLSAFAETFVTEVTNRC